MFTHIKTDFQVDTNELLSLLDSKRDWCGYITFGEGIDPSEGSFSRVGRSSVTLISNAMQLGNGNILWTKPNT